MKMSVNQIQILLKKKPERMIVRQRQRNDSREDMLYQRHSVQVRISNGLGLVGQECANVIDVTKRKGQLLEIGRHIRDERELDRAEDRGCF